MSLGPWTRGDILDLHIFILLIIWMILDRSNIYFIDILRGIKWLWVEATKPRDRSWWLGNDGGPN
jgi:hypothetical protein